VSDDPAGAHRTHVEDTDDPVEVGLPAGNRILVISRVKNSRDFVPLALFDDPPLYFCDSPKIAGSTVGGGARNG
jgi:hypothetical protein